MDGLIIGAISPFLRSFSPSIKTVLILFATILISIGIYVFVDRPIDRFRHKFAIIDRVTYSRPLLDKYIKQSLAAVILLLTSLALFQPYAKIYPPPILVKVVGHYNIVNFNGQFYGIPQGQRVDWQKDNLAAIPGMIIAASPEQAEQSIEAALKK